MVDEVMKFITEADPEVGEAIEAEAARQRRNLELIASENIVSEPVMMAMGSVLTNKYAEGYPGKRYYGGCQCVDVVESIAIERAKKLFGCDYANVQPHSGAQANMAVFIAMLKPGDTVMGMNLDHGGHLTHGSPANFSGAYFNIVPYGVNDDGVIDYEEVRRIANECHPKLIVAGASAYARIIDFKKFREIADEVVLLDIKEGVAEGKMLDIFQKGAKIQLHADTDEICSACPNNEKGCCSSFSLVEAYDNAVLELCGLENGQIMEFDDFTDIVQKKILASGKRKEICGNCQWNSICESQKSRWEKC